MHDYKAQLAKIARKAEEDAAWEAWERARFARRDAFSGPHVVGKAAQRFALTRANAKRHALATREER